MPTRRGLVLFGSGVVLILAGRVLALAELTTVGFVLTAVVVTMIVVIWVQFLWARWLKLRIDRRRPRANVFAGRPFTVTLVATASRSRLPLASVAETIAATDDPAGTVGRSASQRRKRVLGIGLCRTGSFPYRLSLPRGVHQLGPGQISLVDPLGVARVRFAKIPTTGVHVWPATRLLPFGAVDRLFTLSAANPEPERGDLRDYVVGDDLRHVHWPSSARADRLIVRNTESARRTQRSNLLVVDIRASSSLPDFELVLSVAATLLYSLDPTDDVELVLVGATGVVRISGYHQAMDALCLAVPERASSADANAVIDAFASGVVVANSETQLPVDAHGPIVRCTTGGTPAAVETAVVELVVGSLDDLETELDQLAYLSVPGAWR